LLSLLHISTNGCSEKRIKIRKIIYYTLREIMSIQSIVENGTD